MNREDWIGIGLILGLIATVGILVWLTKKSPRKEFKLKRISEPRVVLRNLERRKIVRDKEGRLKEIIIHREVKV